MSEDKRMTWKEFLTKNPDLSSAEAQLIASSALTKLAADYHERAHKEISMGCKVEPPPVCLGCHARHDSDELCEHYQRQIPDSSVFEELASDLQPDAIVVTHPDATTVSLPVARPVSRSAVFLGDAKPLYDCAIIHGNIFLEPGDRVLVANGSGEFVTRTVAEFCPEEATVLLEKLEPENQLSPGYDCSELLDYKMPMTRIVGNESIADIADADDEAFMAALDEAMRNTNLAGAVEQIRGMEDERILEAVSNTVKKKPKATKTLIAGRASSKSTASAAPGMCWRGGD